MCTFDGVSTMKGQESGAPGPSGAGCNVSSTFNFTVGAIAISAAIVIVYLVYRYWTA